MLLTADQRAFLRARRAKAQAALLAWFAENARDLPWRTARTPYRIWVAEVMLQQTQVATAADYYPRFLERFPTIDALAGATQGEVLKLWEGLGYYRRARALHRAAQLVVAEHGGELPADIDALEALPGIGPYTAGAIASLAFGLPTPAVDGNVRRVMARVLALAEPSPAQLRDAVAVWIPQDAPGAFNEGLIELGATICTPHSPQCLLCPWRELCQGRAAGDPTAFPAPKPRKSIPHYDVAAAVTLRGGDPSVARRGRRPQQVLVAQRRPEDMLGGLWEFPGGKRQAGESLPEALRRELQEELAIDVRVGEELIVVNHAYTHFRITLTAFLCELEAGAPRCIECADVRWATMAEVRALPMAVTDRKIAERLEAYLAR